MGKQGEIGRGEGKKEEHLRHPANDHRAYQISKATG